jgi:hypothetical protein
MLKLTKESMKGAIERAKAVRPHVRRTAERVYAVRGTKGNEYRVEFKVIGGLKLAQCNCPSAKHICYHIAAAAAVNIGIHRMRQGIATPGGSTGFMARNVGWMI